MGVEAGRTESRNFFASAHPKRCPATPTSGLERSARAKYCEMMGLFPIPDVASGEYDRVRTRESSAVDELCNVESVVRPAISAKVVSSVSPTSMIGLNPSDCLPVLDLVKLSIHTRSDFVAAGLITEGVLEAAGSRNTIS